MDENYKKEIVNCNTFGITRHLFGFFDLQSYCLCKLYIML